MPFAQLLPLARQAWAALARSGFSPRFETTQSWAQRVSAFAPEALDIAWEPARDLLVAQQLLHTARAPSALVPLALVEAASELARRIAGVHPAERAGWVAGRRALMPLATDTAFEHEATLVRLALEWAARSRQPTDVLWDAMRSGTVSHLFVLQGLQADPLVQAWHARWPERITVINLLEGASAAPQGKRSGLQLHEAADAEDEAQRAAACVLRHLQAGRFPVALATTDRVVSRRVQALLSERGVAVRDETGWRLSTTRAAATLLRTVELWAPEPATDGVIDWLQHVSLQPGAGITPAAVMSLESRARQLGIARWPDFARAVLGGTSHASPPPRDQGGRERPVVQQVVPQQGVVQQVEAWRADAQRRRTLAQWLLDLRALLQACGLWPALAQDAAGQQMLEALRLVSVDPDHPLDDLSDLPAATRLVQWTACAQWVRTVLEQASFRPPAPEQPQVVLLPLAQLAGRDVAAAVLPGCDEAHLPQVPALAGVWTRAQREALGLPTAADAQQAQQLAWADALNTAWVDVLWRRKDALGNPVSPSGFVERLLLQGMKPCDDPREQRSLQARPAAGAAAVAPGRAPQRLSASAYADLRACPYRFFALRMLRLREDDEIDTAVDKREFGSWLHRVLHDFHLRAVQSPGDADMATQRQWLDDAAQQARRELGLSEAEFLPFIAAWPDLRDRYLAWWEQQQRAGVAFVEGEVERERTLMRHEAQVVLHGRLDRVDRVNPPGSAGLASPALRVIDYKTEGSERTRQRVKQPFEDTQMAVYAALVDASGPAPAGEATEGGYLQIGEREAPRWVAQPELTAARDALLAGVVHDLDAIAGGAELPALGSGSACEHCAAHGLCRKEHWQ